jgi:hypothetical protein
VLSVKNPEAPGPANATIDNPAKYSEALQKRFRNLRWMPLEPEHLDYEGTQFLVIGEGLGDFGKAIENTSKDKKDDSKESSEEEIEKLEEEVRYFVFIRLRCRWIADYFDRTMIELRNSRRMILYLRI